MKIEINVDETQMKDVLEKELSELPKDVIREIITESIREYFTVDGYKNTRDLFIDENNRYGYREESPSGLLKDLLKGCDVSKLQEVVDEGIEVLKKDKERILREVLCDLLVIGLTNTYNFGDCLHRAISEQTCRCV